MPQVIGIYGGSFDPVHTGHLQIAEAAVIQLALDLLLFIPNARSPLKSSGPSASFQDRVAMLRLATRDYDMFQVSEVEGHRGGTSYTVDTLRDLSGEYPNAKYCLIVGSDALQEFHLWREHEEIRKLARIAFVVRPGSELAAHNPDDTQIALAPMEVSSTSVRARIRNGLEIDGLVPAAVAEYIAARRLYVVPEQYQP
jgi:nicotinate-nucleotide adenylyltransferase